MTGVSHPTQELTPPPPLPENDSLMVNWRGTIFGPANSPFADRIYSLEITCGDSYPHAPPLVRFKTKVVLPCVNDRGVVDPRSLPVLANWGYSMTIETVLQALYNLMSQPSARRVQPEDSEY